MFKAKNSKVDEKQLAAARGDVEAAQARLDAVAAGETDASATPERYAQWRDERGAADIELQRVTRRYASLEADLAQQRQADIDRVLQKDIDDRRRGVEALAERMRTDGIRLTREMLKLVRDASALDVEIAAFNRTLPPGYAPLPSPNYVVRSTPTVPREIVSTKEIELWVFEANGSVIGDQDRVQSDDGIAGVIAINRTDHRPCVKRKFVSVSYYPPEPAQIPEPLHRFLRLPNFDGYGLAFDGERLLTEHVAAMDLVPARPESRRIAQVDLNPATEGWNDGGAGIFGVAASPTKASAEG